MSLNLHEKLYAISPQHQKLFCHKYVNLLQCNHPRLSSRVLVVGVDQRLNVLRLPTIDIPG